VTTAQSPLYGKKILIVDDHPVVREGLSLLLTSRENLVVCQQAGDASEAMQSIAASGADMVILDISLGGIDGVALARNIKDRYPALPILVLSLHDEALFAERALRAGARGYIMKNESSPKIMEAVLRVLSGEIYLSEKMSARLLRKFLNVRGDENQDSSMAALTARELEIFQLIGLGQSTREIAETLHLSTKTVDTHRAHIIEKLKFKNTKELSRYAFHWAEKNE
jgi:DNA-binding NarL/FixJ family response regulator